MLSSDMTRNNALMQDIKARTNEFTTSYNELAKMNLPPEERKIINQIGDIRQSYLESRGKAIEMAYNNQNKQAYDYYLSLSLCGFAKRKCL